jgi:hypothetical protein
LIFSVSSILFNSNSSTRINSRFAQSALNWLLKSSFVLNVAFFPKALVKEAVHGLLPAPAEQKNDTDAANLVEILAFLKENGYPTSRGKMYKLTSAGDIPHRIYNGKLVFSRKEVLKWAASQTRNRHDYSEITRTVARSARRKMK